MNIFPTAFAVVFFCKKPRATSPSIPATSSADFIRKKMF